MLRVIGAHYKSRDERMARHLHSPDVCGDPTCDITLSFFLKGGREGGGEKSVSIFACENPFAIDNLSSRYISQDGENDGG